MQSLMVDGFFVFMHAEAWRRTQSDQSWQKSKQRPQCQFWIYHAMTFVGALCWLLLHFDVSCAFSWRSGVMAWWKRLIGFFDKAEVFFHPFRWVFSKYIASCRQSDIIWIRWVSNWNPLTILQSQKSHFGLQLCQRTFSDPLNKLEWPKHSRKKHLTKPGAEPNLTKAILRGQPQR